MPRGTANNPQVKAEKCRMAKLGKKRPPFSTEWKRRLGLVHIGNSHAKGHTRIWTEEERARARLVHLGKPKSAEHRRKLALAHTNKANLNTRGEKHWNWQGGKTALNMLQRRRSEYKAWRQAVFERDDFRCFDCGTRGGTINAHHVFPYAVFPRLRLDLNNGVTLCKSCHNTKQSATFAEIAKYKL